MSRHLDLFGVSGIIGAHLSHGVPMSAPLVSCLLLREYHILLVRYIRALVVVSGRSCAGLGCLIKCLFLPEFSANCYGNVNEDILWPPHVSKRVMFDECVCVVCTKRRML